MSSNSNMMSGLALVVGTLLLSACGRSQPVRYAEPAVTEPHATVTISRVHTTTAGPLTRDVLHVNGLDIPVREDGQDGLTSVRVHPDLTHWFGQTRSWHTEQQLRPVTRVYYTTSTNSCGYRDSHNNCSSTSTTITHYRTDMVWQTIEVDDAKCDVTVSHQLDRGRSYRVSFVFNGDGACTAKCSDITDGLDGVACREPEKDAKTGDVLPPPSSTTTLGLMNQPPTNTSSGKSLNRPLFKVGVVTMATGSAAVATGLMAALVAMDGRNVASRHCDETGCDQAGKDAQTYSRAGVSIANVTLIAGIPLVVAGLSLILFGPAKPKTTVGQLTDGGVRF